MATIEKFKNMGTYLSSPKTEKISQDMSYPHIDYGVSGMQGWRISMEDAHCCIANLGEDEEKYLFGVFDGHGGKEVAEYCAQNISKFLLDTEAYTEGNIKAALKEAFMTIDEAITCDEVIAELKKLGEDNENDADDNDEDEAEMLLKEANMPLEEVLKKFTNEIKVKLISNGLAHDSENEDESEKQVETANASKKKMFKKLPDNLEIYDVSEEKLNNVVSNEVVVSDEATIFKNNNNGKASTTSKDDSLLVSADKKNLLGETAGSSSDMASIEDGSSHIDINHDEDNGSCQVDNDDKDDIDYVIQNDDDDNDDDSDEESDDGSEYSEDDGFQDSEGVQFQQGSEQVGKDSGTTAVVAMLHGNKLYVANAGDSRCVLCRNGKAIDMSIDHKPEDELERKRIKNAGSKITSDGRVNGGLNLSRAIGDHNYKQNKSIPSEEQAITACPDIQELLLSKEDSFMVLACDGIWNVMSSEEVIQFVKKRIDESDEKIKLSTICEELFDKCLSPNTENDGSGCDNMTCIIVRFKHQILENKISQKRANADEQYIPNKKQKK
ncbi:uncharacterized protein LOC100208679 isoform X2 [Hydra vulgaris]|uniref:uncharacterized protein LOC100208679 isoform X2 n=1 Tax=Hydra vulgaris TaxID=6087 RepID=UPI001F5F14D2|nr:probable protein phosphatase 2C 60 isoform X1 [Hydra vulgaris]